MVCWPCTQPQSPTHRGSCCSIGGPGPSTVTGKDLWLSLRRPWLWLRRLMLLLRRQGCSCANAGMGGGGHTVTATSLL